jgi:hypothetical protein
MMVPRTVSAPEGGGPARTSRGPTAPELLREAWHVGEDLPLFLTAPLYRRWHLHWGATPAEASAPMPGDDLVPGAQYRTTRAITVAAPSSQVWPWLVQVGCLRAGFYSNDLLDNLAHPSASSIVPELQHLEVGQLIPMSPSDSAPERSAFKVHSYQVNQWLLWSKPDSTWAWSLTPTDDGGTRLVTRIRARYDWRQPLAGLTALVLMEFGDFAMLRRMLRGIKARAEAGVVRSDEASGHITKRPVLIRHGSRLCRRLAEDADVARLPAAPEPVGPVQDVDLTGLPESAQRYLRRAGVVGRAADWSFVLHSRGRFRLRRGWPAMPCEAWQYNSALAVARVFWMRIDAGPVTMLGRDSYLDGRGVMRGRLANLVTVAAGSGPEYDVSELVTFLNDAVLFAPSMLLRLPVSWAAAGDQAFDVTLTDRGHRVTARVYLDDHDLPCDFSTDDRYSDTPKGPVRTRWHTPVEGWRETEGRWLPSLGWAVWDMPDGPLTYAEFTFGPDDIRYNVAPARLQAGHGPQPRSDARAPALQRLADAGRNLRNWGATAAEQQMTLPGDEFVPDPADVITRAVTINAPTEDAWRWLIQIGQNRGGMYSYDSLENMLGLRIHSAREIRPEWQQLAVGDEICLVRPGWLGLTAGFALPVARIDPGRAIVLREQPPAQPWDAIWSFHLLPTDAGYCRLLSRSRASRQRGPARIAGYVMDPVTLLMTRKMLLGIKARAEAARSAGHAGKPA